MVGNVFFTYCILIALVLVFFSTVTVECVVVGASMRPKYNNDTKKGNDTVYVNTLNKVYNYGDIIVINVQDRDPIIKRVIALPGDVVDVVFDENDGYKLEINGKLIEEDYLLIKHDEENILNQKGLYTTFVHFHGSLKENHPELFMRSGKLVVPNGEIFALGDNRHDSKDSTYYGTFKMSQIAGVVELERKAGEGEFKFYWNYVTNGKFFSTIANCFNK